MSWRRVTWVVLIVAVLGAVGAYACTDIVAGKLATIDGSVITSHTCDGRYDSRVIIVPAADHEPGEMAPVYEWIVYGDRRDLELLGEIPQVAHTYKYFNVAYPFANEYQVLIGETTISGARATANSDDAIMTIEQLEVFALQRATTAREAIQIMGDLAVEYGYRESCNLGECLTVTDPDEAWVFEVFGVGPLWTPDSEKPGAVWCAQRVPDDHITCVPNVSRIDLIDPEDTDYFMVCDNYITTAVELGLYDPDSGQPFRWKFAYGGVRPTSTSSRLWRVYSVLAPSGNWSWDHAAYYPFSVKPDEKVSVQDIIALYRDTMSGTEYDIMADPAWLVSKRITTYDEAGNRIRTYVDAPSDLCGPEPLGDIYTLIGGEIRSQRLIAIARCSYFFVSQARDWLPAEIGGVLWFGLNDPAYSPFIPLYTGVDEVPESWTVLDRDTLDRDSSWWAFGLTTKLVNAQYTKFKPVLDEELLGPMQDDIFGMQAAIEQTALQLYQTDPALARQFLTAYTCSRMNAAEAAYWDFVDELLFSF